MIQQQLTRSIAAGLREQPADSGHRPLGDHPAFRRIQCLRELDEHWDPTQVRLLSPPPDLITQTLIKLRQ